MIPARHFDHVVTVWGSQETRGATFGDVERQWSRVPNQDHVGMAIQAITEGQRDMGPGEHDEGEYRAFAHASMDVIEGDVVEIHSGPEASVNTDAPRLLRVKSSYKPRLRHTQLRLVAWMGEL